MRRFLQNLETTWLTKNHRPEDVVIAVMGVTGSGKSTFISHFVESIPVSHTLRLDEWVHSN
jgi:uridine kinase